MNILIIIPVRKVFRRKDRKKLFGLLREIILLIMSVTDIDLSCLWS